MRAMTEDPESHPEIRSSNAKSVSMSLYRYFVGTVKLCVKEAPGQRARASAHLAHDPTRRPIRSSIM